MKDLTKELVNFKVGVTGVAESLPELIEACGGEDRVVAMCNAHTLAHSHYTKLRNVIASTLEELTEIKRGEKETVQQYVSRLEEDFEGGIEQFADAIVAKTSEIKVDYTARERGDGTGSAPAKKWLAIVDQLIEENRYDEFLDKHDLRDEDLYDEENGSQSDAQKAVAAHKVKEIVREREKQVVASI